MEKKYFQIFWKLLIMTYNEIKKKLVDAAFWIGIATLFYFWSILFFALVIIALIYYSQNDIKNWIIPFISLIVLVLIVTTYHIIFYDAYFPINDLYPGISLEFTYYNSYQSITKFLIILVLFVIMSLFFARTISEKTSKFKPAYILIAFTSLIALLIEIVAPDKNGGELIFVFSPLAIMTANFLEKTQKKWIVDLILTILLLISIYFLVLNFFSKG